ncbi:P-loop containing nucleoside triphosphate hydrolase protein [Mycena pura]|uniref:P-loop containing nucleoside triphosphate hydrolase protein n=1 Tax=Mycena pura TaxID=153505 RepID=A0AAD6VSI1_9AGAR|nr:P-loop containing nucleoside triphosphate hydrolase protein [Mycena pura]
MAGAASQLVYVFHTVRSSGHGPVFAALCFVGPILDIVFERSLWSEPHIIEATDPQYLRMKSLLALSDRKYKQDIITGDIVQHITKELRRTIKLLGDTDSSSPYQQYRRLQGTPLRLAIKLASDLPMLYYAGNAIMNPTKFSLSTVATLQQIESLFSWTFQDLFYHAQSFFRGANKLQAVYDLEHVVHETKGGDLPYPPLGRPHEQGMPLELKDVSFSYPGASNKALDNVSLSIKAGQLVVIVGANGSGKSTIVNLLTRLYDATSGSITIDGEDIQKYRIADIRRATAALTQDHHLFPLSLSENIGLGNTAHVSDMDMIRAAAKQGGADGLLTRLADGFDTVLERPSGLQWGNDVQNCETTLLAEELEKMKKETDISGESFTFVVSRTFMRFTSGAVKLSHPEGESQLFKNLRQVREGKTMIFVTHRFAHLTKHADLILCMKEGSIIESGTHQELMNIDGEYCKMFNIQADDFD